MFEDVKVGDTVYLLDGKAMKVDRVGENSFVVDGFTWRKVDGYAEYFSPHARVFWQPVHIEPPPRPKRKVTKWIVVHKERGGLEWKTVDCSGSSAVVVLHNEEPNTAHFSQKYFEYKILPIEVEE